MIVEQVNVNVNVNANVNVIVIYFFLVDLYYSYSSYYCDDDVFFL